MTRRGSGGKRKGKRGEKGALLMLKECGWYIASTEIQGLAGDDIFARDASGKWWAIEVKNTSAFHAPRFTAQAKRQATERVTTIRRKMAGSETDREVMEFLGMEGFTSNDWLILWHPSNANARSSTWVAAYKESGSSPYTKFQAPFYGTVDAE